MAKARPKPPQRLKGWAAIAKFLGQTPSVAQRWHREGMPVTIEGRAVSADPAALARWIGTESGKVRPIRIAGPRGDLVADLKQGLSYVRGSPKKH